MTTRVLHVLDSLDAGGIEKTFLHVLGELGDRGIRDERAVHEVLALSGGPLSSVHIVRRQMRCTWSGDRPRSRP